MGCWFRVSQSNFKNDYADVKTDCLIEVTIDCSNFEELRDSTYFTRVYHWDDTQITFDTWNILSPNTKRYFYYCWDN